MLHSLFSALGAHGVRIMMASLLVGLVFPPAAALIRPALPTIIFLMLIGAMLRVDLDEFRHCFTRPGMLLTGLVWMLIASPLLVVGVLELGFAAYLSPALILVIVLTAGAPNINSTPSLAGMLGLNTGLALALLVFGLLAAPFTLYAMLNLVEIGERPFAPAELSLRLGAMVLGAMAAAAAVRWLIGAERLQRNLSVLDGVNVLMLMGFGLSVMSGVTAAFIATPAHAVFVAVLAIGISVVMLLVTTVAYWPWRGRAAATIAFGAALRNMGVIGGAIDSLLPAEAWLFIGLLQIGIFVFPALLRPVYARMQWASAPPPKIAPH